MEKQYKSSITKNHKIKRNIFMPGIEKLEGVYCFPVVCLSVHPFVCLHKLNVKT